MTLEYSTEAEIIIFGCADGCGELIIHCMELEKAVVVPSILWQEWT